jgi:radical SAM-linked protein
MPVYKYRVSFSKEEQVKYISHLDLSKLFHRAFRRGGLPMAYSEGFNPHPKISLASALRLGTTSSSEYLDVELAEAVNPDEIRRRLEEAMPPGLQIGRVLPIPMEAPAAMAVINAAAYCLSCLKGSDEPDVQKILAEVLSEKDLIVQRNTKNGIKEINLKPLIFHVEVMGVDDEQVKLHLLLAASDQGTARPEEIGQILCEKGLCRSAENIHIHRTGLYRIYPNGELRTPLAVLTKASMVTPAEPAE